MVYQLGNPEHQDADHHKQLGNPEHQNADHHQQDQYAVEHDQRVKPLLQKDRPTEGHGTYDETEKHRTAMH